ncbi:hypothetical protein Trydic_g16352 [Trypoxylus dichotomus]
MYTDQLHKSGIRVKVNDDSDIEDEETQDNIDERRKETADKVDEVESEEVPNITRPKRDIKLPKKYEDHVVYVNIYNATVPGNYEEAINCVDSGKWKEYMKQELKSLERNKTWSLVDEEIGKTVIEVKWIYCVKSGGKYKARVVAKGYQQRRAQTSVYRQWYYVAQPPQNMGCVQSNKMCAATLLYNSVDGRLPDKDCWGKGDDIYADGSKM